MGYQHESPHADQAVELLVTTGNQRCVLIASITFLAFNAVLTIVFVPYFGLEGAALATAAAMAVRAGMLIHAVHTMVGLSMVSMGMPSLRLSDTA